MDDSSDRTAFLLDDPVRMGVVRSCASSARTKAQIAHELGRQPGGLTAVATLEKRGALRPAGRADDHGKRLGGKRWEMDPAWAEALVAAEALAASKSLQVGMDLVLVPATETVAACEALVRGEAAAVWGAPLRGEQMGLILCPSARPDDDAAALRLLAGLGQRGVRALRLHVTRTLSPDELRDWARTVTDAGGSALSAPV